MTDYPRPALTVDCVIIDGTRVLLIKRGHEPFAGRWALPGGFVNPDETVGQAAARELKEETALDGVQLRLVDVFSRPGRDPRGWTVSVAFTADVSDSENIRTRAGDDAVEVRWAEIETLDYQTLAFDHGEILRAALVKMGKGHLIYFAF